MTNETPSAHIDHMAKVRVDKLLGQPTHTILYAIKRLNEELHLRSAPPPMSPTQENIVDSEKLLEQMKSSDTSKPVQSLPVTIVHQYRAIDGTIWPKRKQAAMRTLFYHLEHNVKLGPLPVLVKFTTDVSNNKQFYFDIFDNILSDKDVGT